MKVLIDTNIIMEMLEQRTQADLCSKIFDWLDRTGNEGYISIGSFYTITFLSERLLHHQGINRPELTQRLRTILEGVLQEFSIWPASTEELLEGVHDSTFEDLEDSYQYHAAITSGCSVLITINIRDFAKVDTTTVRVLTPQEFKDSFMG